MTRAVTSTRDIPRAAPVFDRYGAPVGRVVAIHPWTVWIERAPAGRTVCGVPLPHVVRHEDGRLWLDLARDELPGTS